MTTNAASAVREAPVSVDGHLPRRVLLKLSGEALAGPEGFGIDDQSVAFVADKIKQAVDVGAEIAVVIGAGNLWRGSMAAHMDRATADHMGMLATVMNALAVQGALEQIGVSCRVHTAIEMSAVAEPYIRRRAMHQLEKGHVVIIGAGTGNPFFTTDSAAALRAMELGCQLLIKATKVDGIYDCDPKLNAAATRFTHLSYHQALVLGLKVMDSTAIAMCSDHGLPIRVLDLWAPDAITAAVRGEAVGTLVDNDDGPEAAKRVAQMNRGA